MTWYGFSFLHFKGSCRSNKYLRFDFGLSESPPFAPKKTIEGQSLYLSEPGIGYSDLAFAVDKGQKRPKFSFKLTKHPEGVKIYSLDNPKMFHI